MKVTILRTMKKRESTGTVYKNAYYALAVSYEYFEQPHWLPVSKKIYNQLINRQTYGNVLEIKVAKD